MEINVIEMNEVYKSADGFCATDSTKGKGNALLRTAAPKAYKMNWMETRSLWVEKYLNRVFVPVTLRDRFFWMDAITGTLYDQSGKCKTSAVLTINVSSLRNDVQKAQAILLQAKSEESDVSE